MYKDFVGTLVTLCLIVAGFLFLPSYYTAQIDMAKSQEIILNETQLFLDKVADTREITQADLDDFTLALASTSIPVEFEIQRKAKMWNPDPASNTIPKATITAWVPTENIYEYESGDIIKVTVKQVGENFYQSFSLRALGMFTPEVEFTLGRMVR